MHRRRNAAVVVAVAIVALALLPAFPAAAANGSVTSPQRDTTVSDVVPVRVTVQRSTGESISAVSVRLVRDGQSRGNASLSCQNGCGGMSGDQSWGGVSLDPRSPRAFGSSQPLANGYYSVEASVNGGPFHGASRFLVSTAATPVAGLAARVDGKTIRLGWQLPPEPDVSGHVVERRHEGGSWSRVTSLGSNATSYTDTVSGHGTYTYRVFTSRPDGRGGVLTAVSANADAEVGAPPPPSPSPSNSSSPDSRGGPSGSTSDGSNTDSSPDGTSREGDSPPDGSAEGSEQQEDEERTAGPAVEDEGSGDGARQRSSGISRRVAPPPGVRRGVVLSTERRTAPEGGGESPEVAPERHYGEDDEYADELDYGDLDPVTGEPRRVTETRREVVRTPLSMFGGEQDATRATLVSVAAGLLFIVMGLHLFRWMRET